MSSALADDVQQTATDAYGTVPNLLEETNRYTGIAGAVYLAADAALMDGNLRPREQQAVLLTMARYHDSRYDTVVHARMALDAGLSPDTIDQLLAGDPVPDEPLDTVEKSLDHVPDEPDSTERQRLFMGGALGRRCAVRQWAARLPSSIGVPGWEWGNGEKGARRDDPGPATPGSSGAGPVQEPLRIATPSSFSSLLIFLFTDAYTTD